MDRDFLKKLFKLAQAMINSDNRLSIQESESDGHLKRYTDTAHVLKLGRRTIGRDFETYGVVSKCEGELHAWNYVLEEVVMSLNGATTGAYMAGINYLKEQGDAFDHPILRTPKGLEDKQAWLKHLDALSLQ